MPLIESHLPEQSVRRKADAVLGLETGPSARGSTYWGRVLHCAREHLLANVLGWVSETPDDNLDLGLVWHMCLEAYYRVIGHYQVAHAVVVVPATVQREAEQAAFAQLQPFAEEPGWGEMYDKLVKMLDGYFHRWRDTDLWEIVGVECTLGSTRHNFEYTSRLDLVVIDHGGGQPVLRMIEHKCLVEGTMLRDYATGAFRPVEEFQGRSVTALAWDERQRRLRKVETKMVLPIGRRVAYRIETKSGRCVEVSAEHPVLVRGEGWVAAQNLRPGHEAATAIDTSGPGRTYLSDEQVAYVGYMIADGTLSSGVFSKLSAGKAVDGGPAHPVKRDFIRCLEALGYQPTKGKGSKGYTYRVTDKAVSPMMDAQTPLRGLLQHLGLYGRAAEKRVPCQLMELPRRQIGVLLGALWSCDGHIGSYQENGFDKTRIIYTTMSRGLAGDVQELLSRMGIWASVQRRAVKYKGEPRTYWNVCVNHRRMKRDFLDLVLSGAIRYTGVPGSLQAIRDMVEDGDHNHAREKRFDGPLAWDPVVSVDRIGEKQVYALEVPTFHNFVVGGIVTHNSSYRLDYAVLEGYTLDQQTLGQVYLAHNEIDLSLYPPFMGGRVNVTSKPYGKNGNPGYERVDVDPSDLNLQRFVESMHYHSAVARDLYPEAGYPQNFGNCTRRFGRCQFFELCRGRPDLTAHELQQMDEPPPGFEKKHLPVFAEDKAG